VQCDSDARQVKVNYGPLSKKISKTFSFDKVFGMYSTQQEVFDSVVRPIVDETLEGFNCTIFAYGQTGTGKTHTMEGNISSEEDAGIVPRSVRAILEKLEASGAEFTIRVSFLELYNEELQVYNIIDNKYDFIFNICIIFRICLLKVSPLTTRIA
jgi:kinesin family protein 11